MNAQDQEKVISNKELASKMLRGSGLTPKDKAQVILNCGGVLDPTVLDKFCSGCFQRLGCLNVSMAWDGIPRKVQADQEDIMPPLHLCMEATRIIKVAGGQGPVWPDTSLLPV